jgi:membrane-associated HD superfamily phosphohydrolase
VGRHALPLLPFYFWRGNIMSYLLLTAFDLSLGLMLIVGTTREKSDPTTVDARATWLISRLTAAVVLAGFLGGVAAVISIPLFMPAVVFGTASQLDWGALLTRPGFWMPAVVMALLTGARAQLSFESVTTPGAIGTSPQAAPVIGDLEEDRRHSKAAYAAQVTIIATFVGLTYFLVVFGARGLFVLPVFFAALLVFYDTRPDMGQRLFPELWREAKRTPPKQAASTRRREQRRRGR